jgi:hypothetical protein
MSLVLLSEIETIWCVDTGWVTTVGLGISHQKQTVLGIVQLRPFPCVWAASSYMSVGCQPGMTVKASPMS